MHPGKVYCSKGLKEHNDIAYMEQLLYTWPPVQFHTAIGRWQTGQNQRQLFLAFLLKFPVVDIVFGLG